MSVCGVHASHTVLPLPKPQEISGFAEKNAWFASCFSTALDVSATVLECYYGTSQP